jgi:hypothetical protein
MKQIRFTENDAELIKKIMEYQKAHGISSFIGAIRKLCNVALEMEKIRY